MVYVGKEHVAFSPELMARVGTTGAIVVKLPEPFLDKGFKLP